jgi:hypothetical protein
MATQVHSVAEDLPIFDRHFWDGTFRFTRIGGGALGGKASRLVSMKDRLKVPAALQNDPRLKLDVPTMAVIGTDFFDEFVTQNHLLDLKFEDLRDDQIAHEFQKTDLPIELLGDLRALITQVHTPLAIRSSSLLEDAIDRPFAGVYATKMIPNNEFDPDARFRRLVEAIKLVYASTYFREAREYIRAAGCETQQEKMAVILQEVVGNRHDDRFYPDVSGVARSYNYYPASDDQPAEGVVNLALGLGKTIVDGGICWTFTPPHPRKSPFGSPDELLEATQTEFWAVNMGKPPEYDPVNETECMVLGDLTVAERDEVLDLLASTYYADRDRVLPGVALPGPRILNFAPLLVHDEFPLNEVICALLQSAVTAVGAETEIEFAVTFERERANAIAMRVGFLQARPMVVAGEEISVSRSQMSSPEVLAASTRVMGNGERRDICDVVYVRPENFSVLSTPEIAAELGQFNAALSAEQRPYGLIGFGRWGSSHPSLGIPVSWSQISGARVIVESTLPQMNVELSQGSHFFHNLTSFRASYFMIRHDGEYRIDWEWLNRQPAIRQTEFIRHVRTAEPLTVRVDGRSGLGVILHGEAERAHE